MICCKIIANFLDPNVYMSKLLKQFGACGWTVWNGKEIYFANTVDREIKEKTVKIILNRCGVRSHYINIYDQHNEPRETEEMNGWIWDKLIKINYKECEDSQQEVFRNIMKGLDALEIEIDSLPAKEQSDSKTID